MRDYFESVGLAHRREKETRAFPIIVTGDPVTRISTRFAPLENSTQKCAAKTPLTRRESFIDRRRRSSHSSSIYPQLVFSFFPPRIRTYSLTPPTREERFFLFTFIQISGISVVDFCFAREKREERTSRCCSTWRFLGIDSINRILISK